MKDTQNTQRQTFMDPFGDIRLKDQWYWKKKDGRKGQRPVNHTVTLSRKNLLPLNEVRS